MIVPKKMTPEQRKRLEDLSSDFNTPNVTLSHIAAVEQELEFLENTIKKTWSLTDHDFGCTCSLCGKGRSALVTAYRKLFLDSVGSHK